MIAFFNRNEQTIRNIERTLDRRLKANRVAEKKALAAHALKYKQLKKLAASEDLLATWAKQKLETEAYYDANANRILADWRAEKNTLAQSILATG